MSYRLIAVNTLAKLAAAAAAVVLSVAAVGYYFYERGEELTASMQHLKQVNDAYSLFVAACMNRRVIVVGNDAVWCREL